MTNQKLVRVAAKIVPPVFYILLILFLVVYLKNIDYSQFTAIEWNWYFVGIATFFGLAMRFWQVFIWINLLHNLGAKNLKPHLAQLTFVYAKSWLGRYIPGTAPWILGKIFFASKHGIAKSKLAVSSLLEGALQIAVVMVVSLAILLFDARLAKLGSTMTILIIGALIVCVISVWPPIFNRIVSLAYKLVRKKQLDPEHLASNKTIMQGALLYVVSALFSGTALFFIAKAIDPQLDLSNLPYVIGLSNLAGAMGMLAIFAPSGIGVRDGIILALLSLIMRPEYALAATVAARLWDVVIDLLFVATSKIAASKD